MIFDLKPIKMKISNRHLEFLNLRFHSEVDPSTSPRSWNSFAHAVAVPASFCKNPCKCRTCRAYPSREYLACVSSSAEAVRMQRLKRRTHSLGI